MVQEHADTFNSLAKNNLCFTNAVTPSRWSLPSHVSLLSGDPVHKYGCYTDSESVRDLTNINRINELGYSTYCVSGNPFLSRSYGFDRYFDQIYTTYDYEIDDGLSISSTTFDSSSRYNKYTNILNQTLNHNHPLLSVHNLFYSFLRKVDNKVGAINRLPHPYFDFTYHGPYSGDRNTDRIHNILDELSGNNSPFFIISNYMEPHWPYDPPADYVPDQLTGSQVKKLNESVSHPWEYISKMSQGQDISDKTHELIRELYAGEIKRADGQLKRLLELLRGMELLDDTIIIVTSDHGENLGEIDGRGMKRMGHEESVSDYLLQVPLLIANPEIRNQTVTDLVESRNALNYLPVDAETYNQSELIKHMRPSNGMAVVESPADRSEMKYKEYPNVPEETIDRVSKEHTVVVYHQDGWKLALWTNGEKLAWKDGQRMDIDEVPKIVTKRGEEAICRLANNESIENHPEDGINSDVNSRLSDLGYV